ncbi:MAG TPA: hypothetical protein ENI66_00600, partial [Candidatus Yonathbacteria bacterium]|nr:hypothetical protein [Candidatus Yonathbacteria bacterium]
MFHINFGICIRSALLFVLFFMVPTLSSAQTQNYCLVFDGSEIVCVNSLAECVSYSKTLTQYGAVDCISGTTQNTIYPSPTNLYPKNPQTDATLILPTQQSTAKGTLEGTLSMDMDPEYPEPNESTSIKLSSTLVDLNRSEIFWYANNNIIASGTGKKEIEVEAGKLGSTTILSVIVKTNDGLRLNKEITIRPSELTLIWEAESYTPPFYKGKALLSPESSVRIVALPVFVANGANIPKETLVYIWRLNGKIVLSGVGETTLEVKGPKPYGNLDISLETSSPSGSIIKTTNIGIGVSSPEIIFYEDRPLEGINYNKALTNEF